MEPTESRQPSHFRHHQPAAGGESRKFGAHDLRAFDVPSPAGRVNAAYVAPQAAEWPETIITDEHRLVVREAGYNPRG